MRPAGCDDFASTGSSESSRRYNQEAKKVCFWVHFRARNRKEGIIDNTGELKRPTLTSLGCFGVTSIKKHEHGMTRKKSLVERCRTLRRKSRDNCESEDEKSLLSEVSYSSEDSYA